MSHTSFGLQKLNVNFWTKCTQYILFLWAQCQSSCKPETQDVLYILYLLCTLGLGNTEYNKKKNAKKINFLLAGQTKTNMYFVTCICTLTARNDIFQRVFVVLQRTFLSARAHVRPAPPHLKPVHFLKNRSRSARPCATRTRWASARSSLKKSSPARPSPYGSARSAGQNSWTAHLCCGNSSLLFKELSRQFSSFQRTVGTVLKIGTVLGLMMIT